MKPQIGIEGRHSALAPELSGPPRTIQGQRPYILEISGTIAEQQLRVQWTYSQNLYRRATIEMLAHFYLEALQALIQHCLSPQTGGYTPSDFPEADLSQAALDAIMAKIAEAME